MKRAIALANSYRGACIRIAKAGPDNVDLAMSVYFVQQFNVNKPIKDGGSTAGLSQCNKPKDQK